MFEEMEILHKNLQKGVDRWFEQNLQQRGRTQEEMQHQNSNKCSSPLPEHPTLERSGRHTRNCKTLNSLELLFNHAEIPLSNKTVFMIQSLKNKYAFHCLSRPHVIASFPSASTAANSPPVFAPFLPTRW